MKAIWLPLSTVAVKWLRGRSALRYHLLLQQSPRARVNAAVSPLCELVDLRWNYWKVEGSLVHGEMKSKAWVLKCQTPVFAFAGFFVCSV